MKREYYASYGMPTLLYRSSNGTTATEVRKEYKKSIPKISINNQNEFEIIQYSAPITLCKKILKECCSSTANAKEEKKFFKNSYASQKMFTVESIYPQKNLNHNVTTLDNPIEFGNCLFTTQDKKVIFAKDDYIHCRTIHFPTSTDTLKDSESNSNEMFLHSRIKQLSHCPIHNSNDLMFMARTDNHCSLLYSKDSVSLKEVLRFHVKKVGDISSHAPSQTFSAVEEDSNKIYQINVNSNFAAESTTINSLSSISIIEQAQNHAKLLYAGASSQQKPLDLNVLYTKSLHQIDLRCNSSQEIWNPSYAEHFPEAFSVNSILSKDLYNVYVSTTYNKVYQIDVRMPFQTLERWGCLSQNLAGTIGVATAGDLLAKMQGDIIVAQSRHPASFGMRLYYPSSKKEQLFHTKPLELSISKVAAASFTQILPCAENNVQTFYNGLSVFKVPLSNFHHDTQNRQALCILTLTNVGDIYAHTLLEKTTRSKQRYPVPIEFTHNNSNHKDFFYTLSNQEPIPHHAANIKGNKYAKKEYKEVQLPKLNPDYAMEYYKKYIFNNITLNENEPHTQSQLRKIISQDNNNNNDTQELSLASTEREIDDTIETSFVGCLLEKEDKIVDYSSNQELMLRHSTANSQGAILSFDSLSPKNQRLTISKDHVTIHKPFSSAPIIEQEFIKDEQEFLATEQAVLKEELDDYQNHKTDLLLNVIFNSINHWNKFEHVDSFNQEILHESTSENLIQEYDDDDDDDAGQKQQHEDVKLKDEDNISYWYDPI